MTNSYDMMPPYEMWEALPDAIRECIPAPASNSYSRHIKPENCRRLQAVLAVMGVQSRDGTPDDGGSDITQLVDPGSGIAVLSSMDNGTSWAYLPGLYTMTNSEKPE